MNVNPDRPSTSHYICRDCGSAIGFRSRRRTLTERFILPLFLLKPVRCGECFRRDYRLIFTPVRDRQPAAPRIGAVKAKTASNRNVA